MNFNDKLNANQTEDALSWKGTLGEYLELVVKNPHLADNAHKRIYTMIKESGVIEGTEKSLPEYKFFSKEIFGLENVFKKLMDDYFKPAANGTDVKKRLLMLMGPVSGGKSSIVTLLKKGLEEYSKTPKGAVYGIVGCPMNSDPLLLLSEEMRKEFKQEYGIDVQGEVNPYTKQMIEEKYEQLSDVEVERIFLSEKNRVGIGTFSPSDPKSQDISELIGSIDFSTVTKYGSESDPRAYRFDGELNISNRGLMEFQEMLKCDEKFLWSLLSLTQEQNFKVGRFALIDADELIIAHTNEAEYEDFIANPKNEALISRMMVVKVPYNMNATEETKIYEKSLLEANKMSCLFMDDALEAIADFSVMTRIDEEEAANVYAIFKRYQDDPFYKRPKKRDGMDGLDPRFVINRLSSAALRLEGVVDAFDLLDELKKGFEDITYIEEAEEERYNEMIEQVRKKYQRAIEEKVREMVSKTGAEGAKTMLQKYMEELEKQIDGKAFEEAFLKKIETYAGISEPEAQDFRDEIIQKKMLTERKGETFSPENHESLVKAIKKFNEHQEKETIVVDEKAAKAIIDKLVKDGMNRDVAKKILDRYADSQVA